MAGKAISNGSIWQWSDLQRSSHALKRRNFQDLTTSGLTKRHHEKSPRQSVNTFEAVPVVRLVLVADGLLSKIRNGDSDGAAEQGPQTADTDKGGGDAPVDVEV